jgi:hypothetical protein
MKTIILTLTLICCIFSDGIAQQTRILKKVIELQMPEGSGANGASVVYHPVLKKYYASFAGNIGFPMAVFDIKGKRLSQDDLTTGFDVRGLWYNPTTKTIQANGYADFGWTNFSLDKKGIPTSNTVFKAGMYQPEEQSVGAYDARKKQVYFLYYNKVVTYDLTGTQISKKALEADEENPSYTDPYDDEEDADEIYLPEGYNSTTVVFTGIPKAEWGLYDTENSKFILFDKATGKITKKVQLGEDIPKNTSFCFAYTNGIVFLFDKNARAWYGYK